MSAPSLSDLQAWFLTAIMTPGGGLSLAQQRYGLGELDMLRAAAGTGHSRLHIYTDGYVLRLLECMRADFPVLRKVMGAELFDFFAKAYVWRHPSRSTTLYGLGAGFADFLASSQPAGGNALFGFPVDLARFERARSEAGRARGLEQRTSAPLDSFALLSGDEITVRLAPCTRLLAQSFPVQAFWQQVAAMAEDAPVPPAPAPDASFVAVGRQHYRVSAHVLQPWQYHYLLAAKDGAPASRCALLAARACGVPAGRVLADALLWLPQAASAALLVVDRA